MRSPVTTAYGLLFKNFLEEMIIISYSNWNYFQTTIFGTGFYEPNMNYFLNSLFIVKIYVFRRFCRCSQCCHTRFKFCTCQNFDPERSPIPSQGFFGSNMYLIAVQARSTLIQFWISWTDYIFWPQIWLLYMHEIIPLAPLREWLSTLQKPLTVFGLCCKIYIS